MREALFRGKGIKLILVVFSVLCAGFIYIDFFNSHMSGVSNILKFAVMLFSFGISVFNPESDGFLMAALFFTLLSDGILLFTNYFTLGVLMFSIAHLCHFLRHGKGEFLKKIRQRAWILCFLPFVFFIDLGDAPSICIFYAICLGANLALSIYFVVKEPSVYTKMICLAFVLFVLCDINVAYANITGKEFYYNIIWLFYAPSQIIFALSPRFRLKSQNT